MEYVLRFCSGFIMFYMYFENDIKKLKRRLKNGKRF